MILKYNSRTQVQSTTSLLNRTVILVFNLDVFFSVSDSGVDSQYLEKIRTS